LSRYNYVKSRKADSDLLKILFFSFPFFFPVVGAREKEIPTVGKPTGEDWDSGTSIILFYAPWRLDVAGA